MLAQHNTIQHNTAQQGAAQHSTARYIRIQTDTLQHNTLQHSTVQHKTAQYSTAQHSTILHSLIQYNMRDPSSLMTHSSTLITQIPNWKGGPCQPRPLLLPLLAAVSRTKPRLPQLGKNILVILLEPTASFRKKIEFWKLPGGAPKNRNPRIHPQKGCPQEHK